MRARSRWAVVVAVAALALAGCATAPAPGSAAAAQGRPIRGRRGGELLGQHRRAGRRLARAGDQPDRQPGRRPARLRAHPRRRARSRRPRTWSWSTGSATTRGRPGSSRPTAPRARPWCRSGRWSGRRTATTRTAGTTPRPWTGSRQPWAPRTAGSTRLRRPTSVTCSRTSGRPPPRRTATWSTQIRSCCAGTAVGASESIAAMLTPALGLDLVTPPGFLRAVSEGTDPTAGDTATANEQIATHADRRLRLQQPERHARRAGPGQRGARRRHPGDHDHRDHGARRRHLAAVADGAAPAAARRARDGDRGVTR